jgi:hypothetical protein
MKQENSRTGIVTGVLLIILGAAFLVLQFFEIRFWSDWWPTAIIGVGLLFFIAMLVAGKSAGPLAIPGSVIVMVGLILLFHNTFGFWETWAYAWTLIIFAAGIGISIFGRYTGQDKVRQSGGVVARLGLVLFVIIGIFFELFIGLSGLFDGSSILWPLLLILFGFYLLLARSGLFSALFPRRKTGEPILPSEPIPSPATGAAPAPEDIAPLPPVTDPFQGEPLPVEPPPAEPVLDEASSIAPDDEPESPEPPPFPAEDVDDAERPAQGSQE